MSLPVVRLDGSAFEQGVRHGGALRDRIAANLAVYFDRFETETALPRAEVLHRARRYRLAIEGDAPEYAEGMRGIAEGSGFDIDEVAALNVRYEIMYCQFGAMAMARAPVDGCTSFAVGPEATGSGHTLLGQNWDWIPAVRGAVLHTVEEGMPETLAFTEAGIFGGKIGLNEAGVGLCVNGMTSTDDDWETLRPPFHVRCHRALRSGSLDEAVDSFEAGRRACAGNFLLADASGRTLDLETAPDAVQHLHADGGCLVHTNHFTDPAALGVVEPPMELREHSRHRRRRFTDLVRAMRAVTPEALMDALRDHEGHPFSVCRHEDWTEPPSEHYITVSSIVMDLTARRMWLTDGPPCLTDYVETGLQAAL